MLYEDFNRKKKELFLRHYDEFSVVPENLNPAFEMREYQKVALGRFFYYLSEQYAEEYERALPVHLMFNMATGSGKTLIMAGSILYLYRQGYRNFIFFTRLGNIIQKTKANFLDANSKKYLFAQKITIDGREVKIKEVENFEGANEDDVNIIFSTAANLHARFNSARENAITHEDIAGQKIVLLGDEAHNFQTQTAREQEDEKKNWERTITGNARDLFSTPGILNANREKKNILLEFTATARLDDATIAEKYKDKAIYRYDLKEYRLDGFSKEVSTKQIDAPLLERVLAAVVVSQYRRKVAEKYKISLKPVILFKANRISVPADVSVLSGDNPKVVVSSEFTKLFHRLISELTAEDLESLSAIRETSEQKTIRDAFAFFKKQGIALANLAKEIRADFAPEKCLSVDENDENADVEKKQTLLNSLEEANNEIRAVFATEKLNEGWDVLNLFDIVRLYDSRDARAGKPGKTTVQEAQLIGRGARYCPFTIGEYTDPFRRKFDDASKEEMKEELRLLEQLYYHSTHNPDYISELKKALVDAGIMPERMITRDIKVKDDFKQTDFWKNGLIFLNSREKKNASETKSLADARANLDIENEGNVYRLPTRTATEGGIFFDSENSSDVRRVKITVRTEEKNLVETAGVGITRAALSAFPTGTFAELKKIFGATVSISEFVRDPRYLGGVSVKIKGTAEQLAHLASKEKFDIAVFGIGRVLANAGKNKTEYEGTKLFTHKLIKEIFLDKTLRLDGDSPRAREMKDFEFANRDWFAQNEIWGTDTEEKFMRFMDEVVAKLEEKYDEIALLRNEQFFKIYNFTDGEAFAPDFVLFLKEKKTKRETVYQIFIEPKNEMLARAEPWKETFLLELEKKSRTDFERFKMENKDFKLIGLPFYNGEETRAKKFEQALSPFFGV